MKIARNTLIGIVGLLLLLVGLANWLSESPSAAPPDPTTAIRLPDGETTTLGELVARSEAERQQLALDEAEEAPAPRRSPVVDLRTLTDAEREAFVAAVLERANTPPTNGDLYALGMYNLRSGDFDQARVLLQSVPREHPQWGHAQRRLGWNILTRAEDRPDLAVPYVNRALAEDPFDGNCWEDVARVYLRTLGIPVN